MLDKNYILKLARQSLSIEAESIQAIQERLDDSFYDAVEMIFSCRGRVVVSGIGKSALIAQKVVGTFNSTGTSSVFMHAADALHGDIGMLNMEDIVMILSKSGETPELKALIPIIKKFGCRIISVCAANDSFLASEADLNIYTPIKEEADPNNLAPTASSIVQLAVGDALAISLLSSRGFTREDFAKIHPGGSIGKQIYLTVEQLAKDNEKPQVYISGSFKDALIEMTSKRLGAVVVINSTQEVEGIITDGDIRRLLESNGNIHELNLSQVMTNNPKSISHDALAVQALEMMRQFKITQLVVLKENKYAGIVHIHDILREGIV